MCLQNTQIGREGNTIKLKVILTLVVLIGGGIMLFAQGPSITVDPVRHGNLTRAQESIPGAWNSVDSAQRDNRYRLAGHAAKAKELLTEASREIQMAADTADAK